MDNLMVFLPWGVPLTLFSVLYAAERFSAHRHRRRVERRLYHLSRPWLNHYGLTYPNIPKPQKSYQKPVR